MELKHFLRSGLLPTALLALLFLQPDAAMRGATAGIALWASGVLPALLPFFVVTQLMLSCGALRVFSPLLRPLCRLCRLPDDFGGLIAAGWLSGTPGGVRLLHQQGLPSPGTTARVLSVATCTSPLFLIGTIGALLGSSALGALVYCIQIVCAICNGALWRRYGSAEDASVLSTPPPTQPLLSALPDALSSSCRSILVVGAAIAFFSALTELLSAIGLTSALSRILLFALPQAAVEPLLAGAFEVTQGAALAAQAKLSLPLRLSLLCAFSAFGGVSVLAQAHVFLDGKVKASLYLAQRATHAILSFALCRVVCLFFGSALPAFSQTVQTLPAALPQPTLLPVAFALLCALLPRRAKSKTGRCVTHRP